MKNFIIIVFCLLFMDYSALSQNVYIGPSENVVKNRVSKNAIYEITSKDKGLLIPRLTQKERLAIKVTDADKGLMVFQTNESSGIYIYIDNVTQWVFAKSNVQDLQNILTKLSFDKDSVMFYMSNNNVFKAGVKLYKDMSFSKDTLSLSLTNGKVKKAPISQIFYREFYHKKDSLIISSKDFCVKTQMIADSIYYSGDSIVLKGKSGFKVFQPKSAYNGLLFNGKVLSLVTQKDTTTTCIPFYDSSFFFQDTLFFALKDKSQKKTRIKFTDISSLIFARDTIFLNTTNKVFKLKGHVVDTVLFSNDTLKLSNFIKKEIKFSTIQNVNFNRDSLIITSLKRKQGIKFPYLDSLYYFNDSIVLNIHNGLKYKQKLNPYFLKDVYTNKDTLILDASNKLHKLKIPIVDSLICVKDTIRTYLSDGKEKKVFYKTREKSTAIYREKQPSGVNSLKGQTFNKGVWQTRVINDTIIDKACYGLLKNDTIVINKEGIYRVLGEVPAVGVKSFSSMLVVVNKAGSICKPDTLHGSSEYSASFGNMSVGATSKIYGVLRVTKPPVKFQIKQRGERSVIKFGFGRSSNFGLPEYYTYLKIEKLD